MDNEYIRAKEINEKQLAVKKIVEYTLNGIINWTKKGDVYHAEYKGKLENSITFENYNTENASLGISKLVIRNSNGKMIIHNGDMTSDLHRRLMNCITNQVAESNILQDFL